MRLRWSELLEPARRGALVRPARVADPEMRAKVDAIVREVVSRGDQALRELTLRFDHVALDALQVTDAEITAAERSVAPAARKAMERALDNIWRFHAAQVHSEICVETSPGVVCRRIRRPIERVGLYAPGGTAPLASTVLMMGVPAAIAECPLRVLCTPPRADGSVDPHVLVAASLTGVRRIFKVGGAQAIAAMAYGTETIPKIDKVFGPGNVWVTVAKQRVSEDAHGALSDLPAGPSELLVIADESANPRFAAADLLSQAEHGVDSQVVLVAPNAQVLDAVERELERQLETLPRRQIAAQALSKSVLIEVRDLDEAFAVANAYAPEHLSLQIDNAAAWVAEVRSAGSVFVGHWSPESAGDYASGTNHVLPTHGFARALSGLSVDSFVKHITVQELSAEGLRDLGPTIETLAEVEGLQAHRRAVSLRCEEPSAPSKNRPSILPLARPAVRSLVAYASARGTHFSDGAQVLLDANESPWPGLPGRGAIHRYPEPQPRALVARLEKLYAVAAPNLVVARGTDDVIDALVRVFCEAGRDGIVICPPTYGVYAMYARLQGAAVLEVPLRANDFAIDVEGLLAAWRPQHKLVFVCSPNNPTGTVVGQAAIIELCERLAGRALVVLDEAYVEFSSQPSLVPLVARFFNLVVLRTLSKAFGLAGARCGVGIAQPETIGLIQKVRAPYPLSTPATDVVLEALSAENSTVEQILTERTRLAQALGSLPVVERVFPSDADFLLVRVRDARAAMIACGAKAVIIRDRSGEHGLQNCVRISVGTPDENDQLLSALRSLS